mmetsp:Transcript_30596/g.61999  ORF Transcript_30596/g.61999 Transcript_30596/m.61999 type:complete len:606 (-) Transcript_30596:295-2112(-)
MTAYDALSRDELIQQMLEHDERVASLERQRAKQDEAAALLRSELGAVQIKHKEECYWLRLEVDNLRKDKEAVEDRMAELYRDMREIDNMNEEHDLMGGGAAPVCVDSGYVLHLQSQLSKSMQTMGVLDNQIGMVKRSCDEVVKSLKEEIADVMDDKCRVEMELLNQLAVLDNEKRNLEEECEERVRVEKSRIQCKEEHIVKLKEEIRTLRQVQSASLEENHKSQNGTEESKEDEGVSTSVGATMASTSRLDARETELIDEIHRLQEELSELRTNYSQQGNNNDDKFLALEDTIADQDDQIERLIAEVNGLRQSSSDGAEAVLSAVQHNRDEALETLDRIAEYWEKADESIQVLEDVMEELRPVDDDPQSSGLREKDRYRTLSTLETATLVHSQIKLSLLLVELKCRNQLTTLRNDVRLSVTAGFGTDSGCKIGPNTTFNEESIDEISDKVDEIQAETMVALQQVEANMTGLIQSLEGGGEFEAEAEELRAELGERIDRMIALEDKYNKLESDYDDIQKKREEEDQHEQEGGKSSSDEKKMFEILEREVFGVVAKIKAKNAEIAKLTTAAEEHKVREMALKRELKKIVSDSLHYPPFCCISSLPSH